MSFKTKILITALVIVGFDAVASFLSRTLRFEYSKFVWVSFLIYFVIGYWGAHRRAFVYGMFLGTFAGLVDSTLGWFVSRMIGPFLQSEIAALNLLLVMTVIIIVTASAFLFGSVGAAVCKLFGQTRRADA